MRAADRAGRPPAGLQLLPLPPRGGACGVAPAGACVPRGGAGPGLLTPPPARPPTRRAAKREVHEAQAASATAAAELQQHTRQAATELAAARRQHEQQLAEARQAADAKMREYVDNFRQQVRARGGRACAAGGSGAAQARPDGRWLRPGQRVRAAP